jgi:hypothetical protein
VTLAFLPIKILKLPLEDPDPAPSPIAVLLLPVLFLKAPTPTAVFCAPGEAFIKAPRPYDAFVPPILPATSPFLIKVTSTGVVVPKKLVPSTISSFPTVNQPAATAVGGSGGGGGPELASVPNRTHGPVGEFR